VPHGYRSAVEHTETVRIPTVLVARGRRAGRAEGRQERPCGDDAVTTGPDDGRAHHGLATQGHAEEGVMGDVT
jgi:hypothetical protein